MAFGGGFAGGFADTLVPPTPTPAGGGRPGWNYQPTQTPHETRRQTRSRYRLTIIGTATIAHTPEPVTVTAAAGGDRCQHHTELHTITTRVEATAEHDHTSRTAIHTTTSGRGTIPDPDEWLILQN